MTDPQVAREAKEAWRRHLGLPPGDTADVAEARDWQSGYLAGRKVPQGISGKEIADILEEALEDAALPGEQRKQVMVRFALAWGKRLQRDLDNAIFADIINEEQGQ